MSKTKYTVETESVKIIRQKLIWWPLFQTERKAIREPVRSKIGEITQKKRYCLRCSIEIMGSRFRDKLDEKLKIVQSLKRTDSETKDDGDDEEDEEMPQETGAKSYDTSEREGKYLPSQDKKPNRMRSNLLLT